MMIEAHKKAVYASACGREVWAEVIGGKEAPPVAHPQGRRWGVVRSERGDVTLYAGRLYATTGRRDRRQGMPLADSAESVGEQEATSATSP